VATGLCNSCREEMVSIADKYFDGDLFLPLKVAARLVRSARGKHNNVRSLSRKES